MVDINLPVNLLLFLVLEGLCLAVEVCYLVAVADGLYFDFCFVVVLHHGFVVGVCYPAAVEADELLYFGAGLLDCY